MILFRSQNHGIWDISGIFTIEALGQGQREKRGLELSDRRLDVGMAATYCPLLFGSCLAAVPRFLFLPGTWMLAGARIVPG